MEGTQICWEGYSISEDHNAKTQPQGDHESMAWFAALKSQNFAKKILRGEKPVQGQTLNGALHSRLLNNSSTEYPER